MKPSISIIIPALNEEDCLADSLEMAVGAATNKGLDYEILIYNDGSEDKTGLIADHFASQNPRIQVIHHSRNMGIGYSFRKGVELAGNEYIGWLPGDTSQNVLQADVENIFDGVGKAEIVLTYVASDRRSLFRRMTSWGFIRALNLMFRLKIKYYNGANFYKGELIKSVTMSTDDYGALSEVLIRLLKSGHSYVQVGMDNRDVCQNSKAFQMNHINRVIHAVFRLFWEIQIAPAFEPIRRLFRPGSRVETEGGRRGPRAGHPLTENDTPMEVNLIRYDSSSVHTQ